MFSASLCFCTFPLEQPRQMLWSQQRTTFKSTWVDQRAAEGISWTPPPLPPLPYRVSLQPSNSPLGHTFTFYSHHLFLLLTPAGAFDLKSTLKEDRQNSFTPRYSPLFFPSKFSMSKLKLLVVLFPKRQKTLFLLNHWLWCFLFLPLSIWLDSIHLPSSSFLQPNVFSMQYSP